MDAWLWKDAEKTEREIGVNKCVHVKRFEGFTTGSSSTWTIWKSAKGMMKL